MGGEHDALEEETERSHGEQTRAVPAADAEQEDHAEPEPADCDPPECQSRRRERDLPGDHPDRPPPGGQKGDREVRAGPHVDDRSLQHPPGWGASTLQALCSS